MKFINELLDNRTLWVAILSWTLAGILKVIIKLCKTRVFSPRLIASSGGMPSSHSSFVVAATIYIGLHDGFNTSMFALASILSLVVMYDASGVRRAAGQHASILNIIMESFDDTDSSSGEVQFEKLKELLGHSPLEVICGAALGIIVAILCA